MKYHHSDTTVKLTVLLICGYVCRNYFPKHQAAAMVVATSEPPATQRSTSTPMTASVPSAGPNGVTAHMLGMLSSGNQFSQTATHIQGNAAVTNQGAYMGGRLTPQAMQQGIKTQYEQWCWTNEFIPKACASICYFVVTLQITRKLFPAKSEWRPLQNVWRQTPMHC